MYLLNTNLKKQTELGLLYAIGLFPLLKILSLYLQFTIPLHFVFIIFFTFALTLQQVFEKNKIFIFSNLCITLYCAITWMTATTPLSNSNIKIFTAAYTFINLLLIFHGISKTDQFRNYIKTYLSIIARISLVLLVCIAISTIVLCLTHPFPWSPSNLLGLLTFSRSQIDFRYDFIMRMNPLAFLTDNTHNSLYMGPQLLIFPLIYILMKISGITKDLDLKTSKFIEIPLYTLFTLFTLLINSRAIVIILLCFVAIRFIPITNLVLRKIALLIIIAFPFSIYLLNSNTLSQRTCQFDFVKQQLSVLGNGIGANINALNDKCFLYSIPGPLRDKNDPQARAQSALLMNNLKSTTTFCYDNIHIEFVHYFGYLTYFALLCFAFFRMKNNRYYFYLMSFVFIFSALNFNLFEIIFAPLLLILFHYAAKSPSDESISRQTK